MQKKERIMSIGVATAGRGETIMLKEVGKPSEESAGSNTFSRRELFALLSGRGLTEVNEDRRFDSALRRTRRAAEMQTSRHATGSSLSPLEQLLGSLRSSNREANGENPNWRSKV
jgi:hypothetical protein